MDQWSDEIKQYIKGSNEALGDLYAILKPKLLLVAYAHCRSLEKSNDVVHDVFTKLLSLNTKQREQLFSIIEKSLESYLKVAVRNRTLDIIRVERNREKIIIAIRHIFDSSTENEAQSRFYKDSLGLLLNDLPAREKEIIELHIKGYDNEEISIKLNISYNTVKNNIYEVRIKLRKVWDHLMK